MATYRSARLSSDDRELYALLQRCRRHACQWCLRFTGEMLPLSTICPSLHPGPMFNSQTAAWYEDDMDWDVEIRNQTRHIASAVRALTGGADEGRQPYGLDWDVLLMGHCSDPANSKKPMIVWPDQTVGPMEEYRGLNRHITTVLHDGQRSVHYAENAVCSFAYAMSAKGAREVLRLASLAHGGAFDLMLMSACRDENPTCISVNPEVFDPYRPADGELSEVRAVGQGEIVGSPVGDSAGTTDNIQQSARCLGLFGVPCRST